MTLFSKVGLIAVLGITSLTLGGLPKDDDELMYLPKGTKLMTQKELLFPAGQIRMFLQNGLATLNGSEINGNNRYCFMLLKTPSTRDRVLEQDAVVVTSGTYRSATSITELEISQPAGIFDVGCINGPTEINRRPTIGQFKKEIQGIFEVVMPGPDPIH